MEIKMGLEFAIVLISGLFLEDNRDFFEASEKNTGEWKYVGAQAPPANMVSITSVNPDTGKEYVYFVRKSN